MTITFLVEARTEFLEAIGYYESARACSCFSFLFSTFCFEMLPSSFDPRLGSVALEVFPYA